MARAKILCPNCGRVLGDTEHNMAANLNCKHCGTQPVRVIFASTIAKQTRLEQNSIVNTQGTHGLVVTEKGKLTND